jgi:hypothetical protein
MTTGSWRFGLLTGVFGSLQMLSCIYYGIFLATLLPLVAFILRADGTRYLVVHLRAYDTVERRAIRSTLGKYGMAELRQFQEGRNETVVFAMR